MKTRVLACALLIMAGLAGLLTGCAPTGMGGIHKALEKCLNSSQGRVEAMWDDHRAAVRCEGATPPTTHGGIAPDEAG